MTNLANTMQANAAASMQAVERMGQPMGNENGDGNGDRNGKRDSNNLGGVPMTLASFLKVFAVNANDAAKADPLMRGNCLFGEKTLVALYVTGASHLFIAFDKVGELGLKVLELAFDLHVHTPYQTIMTKLGRRQVSFKLEYKGFVHDLICLPMVGLEMILGFDWMSKNWVLLDCFEQSIWFFPKGEGGAVVAEGYYPNSVLVNYSGEECQGYILLAPSALGDEQRLGQILIVKEFPEVFDARAS
ncbi:uncharacterized protein LOC107607263 [Arachis ipaensis]|uniref:uncharacterized protein LOC107607263 n=1 Tax=Arachis ipaensis TaxID=130454 RepID=UPI0007AEF036|nr:uncharacterized protein LOC107607263 [Arachis ipaensis]XP_025664856.1 uncharacterized protein LOC112763386 [Arachis hypogaea]